MDLASYDSCFSANCRKATKAESGKVTKKNYTSIDADSSGSRPNHPSPASRHAMAHKGRQNKMISAQHPDTPWETRENEGTKQSSQSSIQTCQWKQGRQGETNQNVLRPARKTWVADLAVNYTSPGSLSSQQAHSMSPVHPKTRSHSLSTLEANNNSS